jgi:DnaA family protein
MEQTQLALDLQLRDSYRFENFVVGDNALLLDLLQKNASQPAEPQVFVWGDVATGKSHLLQACCQLAGEQGRALSYMPLRQVINYTPELLDGLEAMDLVCIDDVQMVEGRPDWQLKLFDCINRMREAGRAMVFAAHLPPNELALQLEDLRSRLNWGPVIQLKSLNDPQKQQALQLRAHSRGFELPDNVAGFMLNNYARDLHGLFDKLERLDRASLAKQRRLTVPFVKSVCEA